MPLPPFFPAPITPEVGFGEVSISAKLEAVLPPHHSAGVLALIR